MNGYDVTIERIDDAAIVNLRCSEELALVLAERTGLPIRDQAFVSYKDSAVTVVRLSPSQWWFRTTRANEQQVLDRLKQETESEFAAVTVVSDHFQGFRIHGPDTDSVLAQAISIERRQLTPQTVTRCKFARTGATIYTINPTSDVHAFVESSYADYVDAWLDRAAGRVD